MKKTFLTIAVFALASFASSLAASPICPTTSFTNTDCAFLITIASNGSISGSVVPGSNPYDGVEDSLVGVINNSSSTFTGSIALSSGADIFGFDGDGICKYPGASAAAFSYTCDASGYAGPINTFTVTNVRAGFVNINGLAPGATTFFSLEEDPNTITSGGGINVGGVPEPATMSMIGGGMGMLLLIVRKRRNQ